MPNPRARKVEGSNPNVRLSAEPDSPQNVLRGELYRTAFERIDRGLKEERFFEVIFLADSLITDRIQSLIQTIIHGEDEQYGFASMGAAIGTMWGEVKDRGIQLQELDDLKPILIKVEEWIPIRNRAAHGFVSVTPKTVDQSLSDRMMVVEDAAKKGAEYARKVTNQVGRAIYALKKGS